MQSWTTLAVLAGIVALTGLPAAAAPVQLTGSTVYAAANTGWWFGGWWDTEGPNNTYNMYLFTGSTDSPVFLNSGNSNTTLNPDFDFAANGNYTIGFAAESQQGTYLGMNLYFDGDPSNRISVFAARSANGTFSVTGAGINTAGQNGVIQTSSNSVSYAKNGVTITLTDFRYTQPSLNLVGMTSIGSTSSYDTIGSFTLNVSGVSAVPEPSTFLLAAAGIAGLVLQRVRR